jgi:hypothetical protein
MTRVSARYRSHGTDRAPSFRAETALVHRRGTTNIVDCYPSDRIRRHVIGPAQLTNRLPFRFALPDFLLLVGRQLVLSAHPDAAPFARSRPSAVRAFSNSRRRGRIDRQHQTTGGRIRTFMEPKSAASMSHRVCSAAITELRSRGIRVGRENLIFPGYRHTTTCIGTKQTKR